MIPEDVLTQTTCPLELLGPRTNWDQRFLALAEHVASWSKDPSTQAGAVVVRDRRIVSTGYNGLPQRVADTTDRLTDRVVKYDLVVHAELNALLFADRHLLPGATMYVWPLAPCVRCAVHVIQVGITRVVSVLPSGDRAARWARSLDQTRALFTEANVELIEETLE